MSHLIILIEIPARRDNHNHINNISYTIVGKYFYYTES